MRAGALVAEGGLDARHVVVHGRAYQAQAGRGVNLVVLAVSPMGR